GGCAVAAQAVYRCVAPEQQRPVSGRVLLPDPQRRRRPIRLSGQWSKDGAISDGCWRSGAGGDRGNKDDGWRRVPGRVPERQPQLVRGARVAKEPQGTQVPAHRCLVGALAEPGAECRTAGADLDGDVLDPGEAIASRPVKVQGGPLCSVDPEVRG